MPWCRDAVHVRCPLPRTHYRTHATSLTSHPLHHHAHVLPHTLPPRSHVIHTGQPDQQVISRSAGSLIPPSRIACSSSSNGPCDLQVISRIAGPGYRPRTRAKRRGFAPRGSTYQPSRPPRKGVAPHSPSCLRPTRARVCAPGVALCPGNGGRLSEDDLGRCGFAPPHQSRYCAPGVAPAPGCCLCAHNAQKCVCSHVAMYGKQQLDSSFSASTGFSGAGGGGVVGGRPRQGSRGFTLAAEPNLPPPKGNLPQGEGSEGKAKYVASTGFTGAGGRTVASPLVASTGFTGAGDERGAASKLAVSTGSTRAGGGEVAPITSAGVGIPCAGGGECCLQFRSCIGLAQVHIAYDPTSCDAASRMSHGPVPGLRCQAAGGSPTKVASANASDRLCRGLRESAAAQAPHGLVPGPPADASTSYEQQDGEQNDHNTIVPKRAVLRTTLAPDIRATPFPRPPWWEEDKGKGGNDASTQSCSAAQPPMGVCTNIPTRVKPIKRGSTESANTPMGHSLGHGLVPTTGGASSESADNIPTQYLKTHVVAERGPTGPAPRASKRYPQATSRATAVTWRSQSLQQGKSCRTSASTAPYNHHIHNRHTATPITSLVAVVVIVMV